MGSTPRARLASPDGPNGPADQPAAPVTAPTGPVVWRAILVVVGTLSLVLGLIGIVVPVLPTTPFLLVAAACYARASTRLYGWLLGRPTFGPIVADWRRSRSLPAGVKPRALALVALTFGASILIVDEMLIRAGLAGAGPLLAVFLHRIPTTPN